MSYLQERLQCTKIDQYTSTLILTTRGVPQGSLLSPFLFNLYTSDLQPSLDLAITPQYVDDTSLLIEAENILNLERKANDRVFRYNQIILQAKLNNINLL